MAKKSSIQIRRIGKGGTTIRGSTKADSSILLADPKTVRVIVSSIVISPPEIQAAA